MILLVKYISILNIHVLKQLRLKILLLLFEYSKLTLFYCF